MNNYPNQLPPPHFSPRQHNRPDYTAAGVSKQQSVTTRESLNSGLVIETREGDRVTLTSSSFTEMDAYMYDSKGLVHSEAGTAIFSHSVRELTLASGQSFSFSVAGDLNEQELEDITNIIKGLDGVIAEMREGDMHGAVDAALAIGDYESVSSYSADIRYQSSVAVQSSVAATAMQSQAPGEDAHGGETQESAPQNSYTRGRKLGHLLNPDKFLEKMVRKFEGRDKQLLDHAKTPVSKLFDHHLEDLGKQEWSQPLFSTLEQMRDDISTLLNEMLTSRVEGALPADDGDQG